MSIVIKNIRKGFGSFKAVDDISLEIQEGQFVGLLGPSGSGKTTLLRIIAGLEVQDDGEIYLEGVDATGQPVKERKMGFVFQHFALFQHMTVFENIAFGLRLKRPKYSEEEIRKKVEDLLALVHLEGSGRKYPRELSGGQQQRVSLARVLAVEPKYMLLDEPFGALDSKVRKELRRWLKKLHAETGLTTIFVTHDQEEAMEVSDKIAIINKGKLEQVGTPYEIWDKPVNSFVFDFLGNYNTFYGVEEKKGELLLDAAEGKKIRAFARTHEVELECDPADKRLYLPGKITLVNRAGPFVKLEIESHLGKFYQVDMEKSAFANKEPKMGEKVWIRPRKYRTFNE